MAGRDFSSELFGSEAGDGRNLSAELFGSPPEDKGFFSNIGNLLVEGGQRAIGAAQIAPSVVSGNVGEDQAKLLSEEISRKPSVQPKELLEVQSAFKDEAAAFDKAEGFRESIGPFGDFLLEFGKQAITNPKGAVYLTAQSAANMAPQIAGMLAGGKGGAALGALSANPAGIAIGAGVGAITGGFAASAPLEIGSEFIGRIGEELSNRGMEPTTENITALLKDTKTVEKAVSDARTKGVTTSAVDSLMTVGAGKFASGARKSAIDAARKELGVAAQAAQIAKRADDIFKARTLTQKVGRGAGAVGIDVAGGGISEAAGQGVAYGKVDLQDVGMEMLGELGGAAIEVPAAAKSLAMRPKTAAPEIVAPPDTITPPETVTPPATTEVAELPVTEKQPVAILPPSSVFTEQDILGTEVSIPGGNLPAVRRNVLGKTRDELEAFVNENPEVLENESPTSRVIQSLLQQTGGQRDQPSVELPVPPTEPTVQPDTQGIVTPEPTGMGAPSTFAGETTPTTPIAIPPVTIQPTPEQPNGLTSPETIETETQRPEETGEIILQNRDRSSQASIEQMQVISAKPDYGRMSFSRDFANGAPAVFGGTIDPSQLGAKDVAIAPDGRRIPVRYAVMEVDDVLASNDANGLTNVDYANATDRTRVIAGNGRIAGLQLGYQRKTTDNYVKELKSDLRLHGVDLAAIDRMKQPVLVRIMPNQFVTQNIGDVSNTPTGLRLSATENAKNDLRRVDLNALQFNDDGSISENTIRGFIQAMPQTERGEFIGTKGKPTTQAYDRLNGAIFAKAYNNDQLIELYTQTQDPEARNILSALARVAPKMARLDGAGNLDIRNIVTEAAEIAVNARRQGLPLSRAAQQIDVVADPDVYAVLEMFSNNSRSPKATAEALSNLADNAFEAYNAPSEDFFGEVPRISREELMKNFRIKNEKTDDEPMEDATGRGAPKEDDVQPTPEPARQEPPATNETKAEVTPPPGESVEVQRAAVQRFEMALQQTIPPTRVNATGRRTVLKPKPLSAPQVKLLSDLATRALRLGIPSSLLDRITAGGSTGLNAVAAMFPTRGWLALGSQWSSRSNDEKFFYLIHELAHLAEQDGYDAFVFSKDPSWAKAHKELEAWYKNEPLKNILAYPFNAQFEKSVPNKKAESFAQSFAIYITNPVVLQEKAPAAYSIIANALERLKNESQATTSASPAKREITKNNVLQNRVGSDEDVQSQTGRVVPSVGTTQRGDTGADARQKVRVAPDTPAFRRWFGNSKVVDADGKPLVVYHGTNKTEGGDAFTMFDAYGGNYGLFGLGAYFTENPAVASSYTSKGKGSSPSVYAAYMTLKNPIDMDAPADARAWQKAFPDVDFAADYKPTGTTNEAYYRQAEEYQRDIDALKYEAADELQEALREMGYDGITHIGGGRVKSEGVRHRVFIAFEPEQIKSATGNSGNFDPKERRINLAEAPGVTTEAETVEQKARRENIFGDGVITTWTMPTDTKIMGLLKDDVIYSLQNKQIDLKRVVDSIKSTSKNIGAKWDAYLQETLYHGRTATRTKAYLEDELKKQVEAIQKFGLTKEDVGEYLHNRHAPEANAHIAERNERYPDGGSGIKTADALKYMEDLSPQKRKQFEQVAALIDDGTRKMQDELVEYGLESPETIATWRDMFSFYIPLNRVDADFDTSKAMSQGAGYSTSGASAKSRTGSTKDVNVNEILANLAIQRERSIVRAEKNRVAQALYGLALQNPNPDFWLALDPSTNPVWQSLRMERQLQDDITLMETIIEEGDVDPSNIKDYEREITLYRKLLKKEKSKALGSLDKVRQQLTDLGLDPALVENIMMPPMKARYDKARNKVVYEPNSSFANPFVFSARVNGEDKFLLFNANDARAKRMVESLKNMDADQLGIAMSTMAKITRYFSAINTQYNPVFGAYNFLRDVQAGLIQINDTEIADQKKKVVAGTLPALRAIYQSTRKLRKGEKPETEWSKLYEEFQKEGGQTGFRDVFSQSNERATAIQRMIDPASWSESPLGNVFSANGTLKVPLEQARKTAKPLFDWLSDYNESMENSIRLSAYKAAKDKFIGEGTDAGSAKQRAAAIAKELTVNFNRKGQVATQAGALYAFFNASVQGTTRMFQLLKSPVGKKIAAGAFLLGSMQALLLAGAGFDEEEPPEFIKQRNYIIPIGDGKYLAFPMPLGFNVLPNTTRIITEWALSGFKDTPRRVLDITDAMLDMFNPVGNAGWSFQTFAPTVFDPMVALFENKDWTGQDISRKDFSDLDPTPGYSRSKDSSSWLGEQVAYFLNFASGGTEDKKGALSPTADDLEYLIGQATGGIGREFLKVAKTAKSLSTGEELPPYNVPLFGRFYGDIKGMAPTANAFYRNLTELNGHTRAVEGLKERRGDVQGYIRENPEARLSASANIQYREIQKLRKQRRNAIEKDNKELAKKIEEAIKVRMMRVNESFDEVSK
jgi:uncharacterized membrane protein